MCIEGSRTMEHDDPGCGGCDCERVVPGVLQKCGDRDVHRKASCSHIPMPKVGPISVRMLERTGRGVVPWSDFHDAKRQTEGTAGVEVRARSGQWGQGRSSGQLAENRRRAVPSRGGRRRRRQPVTAEGGQSSAGIPTATDVGDAEEENKTEGVGKEAWKGDVAQITEPGGHGLHAVRLDAGARRSVGVATGKSARRPRALGVANFSVERGAMPGRHRR
ncbi:hypothetical protein BU16DRAFT_538008 [Lophium mytilinum]|uniref:Uncharacterized protein n=1 Tax=Lophium mytilinum TaxID=390894 RepID=A0A6A6QXB7_9PEZI|nr:hypothetical protein BU16DRAFT_538008 [Lophium mytilinum]